MSLKPKVCHLSTVHYRYDTRIFHKQCITLVKNGYDTVFVVADDKENEIKDGVEIISIGKPQNRLFRILISTMKIYFKALHLHPSLCHFHDPELIPVGIMLKLTTKTKVIYDVHENYQNTIRSSSWVRKPFKLPVSILYRLLEVVSNPFFDHNITVTDSIEKKFNVTKTTQIRNYPLIIDENEVAHPEILEKSNQINLVYIGDLSVKRGLFEMVNSLELTETNAVLNLYGRFIPPSSIENIEQFIKSGKVKYHGWLDRKDVNLVLSNSHIGLVLVHPEKNYLNSLPNKLFEYMSAGLPFICSNFDYWNQIVYENNCGLMVDPFDTQKIAQTIDFLSNKPDLRKEMGLNGKKAISEKFNWGTEAKKLISLYENLLQDWIKR